MFCFLNVLESVLYCDYNKVVTLDDMINNILEHLSVNGDYYKQLHTGDLLQDAEGYVKFGNYHESK